MEEEFETEQFEPTYPFQEHLGFELVAWEPDYCRLELPMAQYLMNRSGILHGGVHATLLDTAMGYAGCYTGDVNAPQNAMTLSLNVNYLAQAAGDLLIAEGWRTGGGKSTFFAEAQVRDSLGTLVSSATGVFRFRKGTA